MFKYLFPLSLLAFQHFNKLSERKESTRLQVLERLALLPLLLYIVSINVKYFVLRGLCISS